MPTSIGSPAPPPVADLATQASLARVEVDKLDQSQQRLTSQLTLSAREGRSFGNALTTAFVGLAIQGKGFGDVLRSLALSLSRIALNAAFKPLGNALASGLQGLITSGFGSGSAGAAVMSSATPLAFTASGSLATPQSFPALAGADLRTASSRATPLPAAASTSAISSAAGSGLNVTFHVTTPDAESFRRSETQLAAMLTRAVGQGQRNL